jgi:hypothetical protein
MKFHIQKPQGAFARDYFFFKSKVYNMQLEVVVDYHKKILDSFVDYLVR